MVMTDVIDEQDLPGTSGGGGVKRSDVERSGEEDGKGGDPANNEPAAEDVDDERVAMLVSMGFSRNKALRALHYTGDGTIEQAVEWISSHEEDPECSDEPFVKPHADASAKPKLTPEQAKAKAEELLKQAKIKRENEEKALEKLREAERIRSGKEMAAMARKEEEQRLKRMVEYREREKREEREARERIRKKLEQDRMERRARAGGHAGGSGNGTSNEASNEAENGQLKSSRVVKPREKGDAMRGLLVALKKGESDEAASMVAFQTLNKLVGNVARDPSNPKFRTIKLHNKAIQERVGRFADAVEFLRICGWADDCNGDDKKDSSEGGEGALTLTDEALDDAVLRVALENLDSALNNPFFGKL